MAQQRRKGLNVRCRRNLNTQCMQWVKQSEDGPRIAVIILTLNEAANLGRCLDSVCGLAAEVIVVDSGSTDATIDIAKSYGATVIFHEFKNQAHQFNWALDNLEGDSKWILRLDADEYLLPELRDEIVSRLRDAPDDVCGYLMKRRMIFLGRWIRHGGYYPTWLLRLFRHGHARSELSEMDEHIVLHRGKTARLQNDFVDQNRKGLSDWCLKHERYASRQARVIVGCVGATDPAGLKARFFGNQIERKRWFKNNVYRRAPLFSRAFAYFLYRYFVRLGILDGREGLIFHYLHAAWYLFYVDAKIYEMRKK